MYSVIVFDWDGTLVDSAGAIVAHLSRAAMDLDLPVRSFDEMKSVIGLGLSDGLQQLYPDHDVAMHDRVSQRYRLHAMAPDAESVSLFPGVKDVLTRLKSDGYLLAVATGKSRAGLDRDLERTGLQSFFSVTRCADESKAKPAPDLLLDIMAALSVWHVELLMVGDTDFDLLMANTLEVHSVAVTYGCHSRARLLAQNPTFCIDQLEALLPLLGVV